MESEVPKVRTVASKSIAHTLIDMNLSIHWAVFQNSMTGGYPRFFS